MKIFRDQSNVAPVACLVLIHGLGPVNKSTKKWVWKILGGQKLYKEGSWGGKIFRVRERADKEYKSKI